MLRLCHGLDRYSVDLDFRLRDPEQGKDLLFDPDSGFSGSAPIRPPGLFMAAAWFAGVPARAYPTQTLRVPGKERYYSNINMIA
jgi:hypothetical protein